MLDEKVTFVDLWRQKLLYDPEEFLRSVAGNFADREAELGCKCVVHIGRTGEGKFPNYLIAPIEEKIGDPLRGLAARNTAFSGKSHTIVSSGLVREHWSKVYMTREQIDKLRQAVIGEKRPLSRFALRR